MTRYGLIFFAVIGGGLFVLGMAAVVYIFNAWWPIDVARLDLVRDTALGQANVTRLLEAINWEIMIAFLSGWMVAATGLALPFSYYLNKRFGRPEFSPSFLVVLRQAVWVGLWFTFCLWLQIHRAFGPAIASLVAVVLVLVEILLQVRTKASKTL